MAGFLCALVLLAIAGVVYVYSGQFDVAASSPNSEFELWAFHKTMRWSVVAKANSVDSPPPFTDEMIKDGLEHYDEMCTICHGGPGIERSEIGRGINPRAPKLSEGGQSVDGATVVLDYQARREDDWHAVIRRDA
jgi:hypothetical protein